MTSPVQLLWIPGPLPSLNDLLAAHGAGGGGAGNHYARLKRKWTDDIALLARAGRLRPVACGMFRFSWRERNRQRDPDNVAAGGRKLILDGLVRAGVLANDGWDEVAGFVDAWEVSPKPGVLVAVETVVIDRGVVKGRVARRPARGVLLSHVASEKGVGGANEGPGTSLGGGGGHAGHGEHGDDPNLDR